MKKGFSLFFLMMCSWAHLIGNTISWGTPTVLSTGGVDGSDPRIVVDGSGNLTAVWVESGLVKASFFPNGGNWGTTATLSNASASAPKLGVDSSGNVTALWLESGVVKVATLPLNGSWSAATSLSGSGASQAALATDTSGNAVAVWTRNGFIESSTRQTFGGGWSLVAVLSGTSSDNPAVYIGSSGTTAAVWHTVSSGNDVVQSATALISGTWNAAKTMITGVSGLHHNYPKVVVDGSGNASAVWYRYSLIGSAYSNVSVLTASLTSGASTWGSFATLANSGLRNPADLVTRLSTDVNGNVLAVWTNSYDGETFSVESNKKPFGGNWANDPVLLNPPSIYSFDTSLRTDPSGNSVFLYMYFDGTSTLIQSQEINSEFPSGEAWSAPTIISQGTENGYPRCGYTLSGNTMNAGAVWVSFNGVNNEIQAAIGSKTVVLPPTNLAIVQSVNNFGVFNDYYNTVSWTASASPNITGYNLFRNGVYFASVDGVTLQFIDHNATQNGSVTYGVAAVDNNNAQSAVVNVNFP